MIVGADIVRWGAGATLVSGLSPGPVRRPREPSATTVELEDLPRLLGRAGLDVVAVDLGTPLIRKAGVVRYSVQLTIPSHEPGRSWDADPVN